MTISVQCPQCESTYQVDAGLRGKRMRCPNKICNFVFEVPPEEKAYVPEPPVAPQSAPPQTAEVSTVAAPPKTFVAGVVGELVPLATAEMEAEVAPKLPKAPPQKKGAIAPLMPPPVRARPTPAPLPMPDESDLIFPDENVGIDVPAPAEAPGLTSGTWQAPPPVRGPSTDANTAPAPSQEIGLKPRSRSSKHRPLIILAVMVMMLVGGVFAGILFVAASQRGHEEERFVQAKKLFDEKRYGEAVDVLSKLLQDFPDSSNRAKVEFLMQLGSALDGAYAHYDPPGEVVRALKTMQDFINHAKNDPQLAEVPYQNALWLALRDLSEELTEAAAKEKRLSLLKPAEEAAAQLKNWKEPPGEVPARTQSKLTQARSEVATKLAQSEHRGKVVTELKEYASHPSGKAVKMARLLAQQEDLSKDSEVQGILKQLVQGHREEIVFEPPGPLTAPTLVQDTFASFYLASSRIVSAKASPSPGPAVFALANGVLYALDPRQGEVRWLRRVGHDTAVLPTRVPASLTRPALVLVLSSDDRTVSALEEETGHVLWQHVLAEVCLGQPVLVDHHLLVPTYFGKIEEIEVNTGSYQGYYDLGQSERLSLGGVHQPGTNLVYFPADDYCIYILDVARRECAGILYTQHPAGSLRGLPVVLPPSSANVKKAGALLIAQAQAGNTTVLKAYDLPIADADQKPVDLNMPAVPGRLWYRPWSDGWKIVLATDAARLGVLGVRAPGNQDDPLLFPMVPDFYGVEKPRKENPPRAQVVHADAENVWVLVEDHLHRLRLTFTSDKGPNVAEGGWTETVRLGSPLHEAQVRHNSDGTTTLFTVTLASGQNPAILASAVDADSGQILWQRQLGVIPRGTPIALGDHGVIVRDSDGLVVFEPSASAGNTAWQPVGRVPLSHSAEDKGQLLTDGKIVVDLSWDGKLLTLNSWPAGDEKQRHENRVELPSPPQGTPALASSAVIVPLANGRLARVPFLEKSFDVADQNWRAVGADENAEGHVVRLPSGDFVVTDGSRGLWRLSWTEPSNSEKKSGVSLDYRIIAPPAVVADPGGRTLLAVADASNTLTLRDGENLSEIRRWNLSGTITAGPFVRGERIGCVVGFRTLVWIDPHRDEVLWNFDFPAHIVGEPYLIEGVLVAADQSGRFLALNPQTGLPLGDGYALQAHTVAACTPLPFGPGHCLVPLTDGTAIILPIQSLMK